MTISDQARNNIDEAVDWTAVTSMVNLRNILELVDDTLNDGTFPQEQLIHNAFRGAQISSQDGIFIRELSA